MDSWARWALTIALTLPLAVAVSVQEGSTAQSAAREPDPLARPALLTPRANGAALLGAARAGKRLVAVGERGVVLYSDDNGTTWLQAAVPVSVTLTTVLFIDGGRGWAAGHDGVLLSSEDGGATWKRQFDGGDVLRFYRESAELLSKEFGETDPKSLAARRLADQLAADRRDRPWLDLAVDSRGRLWLAGAYGLLLRSDDGAQWKAWSTRIGAVDRHLYSVRAHADVIAIVGEQGLVLRSGDGGESFQTLDLPYEGSLFTLQLGPAGMTVAGLRGNVFRSEDDGGSFVHVSMPVPVSIAASLSLPGDSVLLADQAGTLYRLRGSAVEPLGQPPMGSPSAMALADDGALVVVGSQGAFRLAAPLIESKSQ